MAKKDRWTEPKLPEVEEVEEEIVVEETGVEPEPEPEPTPEPELKKPAPKMELPEGAVEYRGMVKGKKLFVDAEGNNFFGE